MIARMKKLALVISERTRADFLAALRKAGVVHIKHVRPPLSRDISALEEKIALSDSTSNILGMYEKGAVESKERPSGDELAALAQEIAENQSDKEQALLNIGSIKGELEWFGPWGGFDPARLEELKKEGVIIRLYRLRKDEFRKIEDEKKKKIYKIKEEKGNIYIAFATYRDDERLDFAEVCCPQRGHEELKKALGYFRRELGAIEEFFKKNACLKDTFKKEAERLRCVLEFQKVRFGMKEEEGFSYLEGFCPEKELSRVASLANAERAGYLVDEPDNPDETPTLITNPKWISMIAPLFKFMNTLPGYNEYDISLPFLVFFSLFFAMLIGDAGYGLLFLLATYLVRRRMRKAPAEPFYLIYLLSAATVVWGAVTGTWFGIEKITEIPFFKSIVVGRINSFAADNQDFMMYLCFLIGAVHLSVAHLIQAARVINSPAAFSQLGWIAVIWSAFFAAGTLVIGNPFPSFGGYMAAAGVFFVLVFSNVQKNIIKGILITLIDLPLKVISAFSDVISYIRLFAVGYASVILAQTINDMAAAGGLGGVSATLGAALILFLGHALNVTLGLMAVLVHGVRLNMLEFSGHLGMNWSGHEYSPFKEE